MRVLTYNIHGWRTHDGQPNFDAIAALLVAVDADVVALNEVNYPRTEAGVDGPLLAALAARLGMHFVFGPCLRWPAQDNLPADAYGNALLSRWPILADAAHHLTPVPGHEQRGLLEARIQVPDYGPFTAYVSLVDHKVEAARLTQLRALRTWTVRDRNRPHVVMGDFNAVAAWDYAQNPLALDWLAQAGPGQHMVNRDGGGPQARRPEGLGIGKIAKRPIHRPKAIGPCGNHHPGNCVMPHIAPMGLPRAIRQRFREYGIVRIRSTDGRRPRLGRGGIVRHAKMQ